MSNGNSKIRGYKTKDAPKSSVGPAAMRVVSPVGVMVSPGRYVNLANPTFLSYEQQVRRQIDQAMRTAKFTHFTLRCENRIYEAIGMDRKYLVKAHHSYQGAKVTRQSFGTTRPNNRTQEAMRILFIASLWAAWVWGRQALPKVNNRRNPDTDFVIFVKSLSPLICMGNVVKNLERYQSYRKATMRGLSYGAWQASHPI